MVGSDVGVRVRAPIGRWERHLRGAGAAGQVGEPSLYGPPAEQRRARMHVWCVSGVIRCVAMPAAPPHAGRRLHPDTFVAVCHRWPARGTTTIRGQDDPRTYPGNGFFVVRDQTFKARLSVNPPRIPNSRFLLWASKLNYPVRGVCLRYRDIGDISISMEIRWRHGTCPSERRSVQMDTSSSSATIDG